jgi:DNA-binding transcriptional LysR family regulator
MNINAMDLNLLRALDVLVRERNVTRAGRALGLSQPAMSNALTRLRTVLSDPILVRSPEGMLPTPRALEIAEPVRQALALLSRAVSEHDHFDPLTSDAKFRVALMDHSALAFMPGIVKRLGKLAPNVSVEVIGWRGDEASYRDLQAGELDLLLTVGNMSDAPAGIYRRRLFGDRFVCIVRKGNPQVPGKLDIETYTKMAHILVAPRGGRRGIVDDALEARGLTRHVAVVVPHFVIAPVLVSQTDLICTISEFVARPMSAFLPLEFHEPPLEFSKGAWFQLWHERTHYDPAHRWFREQVTAIATEITTECTAAAERDPMPESKRGAAKRQMKRLTP